MQRDEYLKLWVSLVKAKDAISKIRQKELEPFNISPEQSGILFVLTRVKADPTPADLSRLLIRDPSSITIMLKRMEARGLITKSPDRNKKNLIRVTITDKGKEIYNQVIARNCVFKIMSGLTDEQCHQLKNYLDILLTRAFDESKENREDY
jgi:DNA-binding MarR family transcriptional regulator